MSPPLLSLTIIYILHTGKYIYSEDYARLKMEFSIILIRFMLLLEMVNYWDLNHILMPRRPSLGRPWFLEKGFHMWREEGLLKHFIFLGKNCLSFLSELICNVLVKNWLIAEITFPCRKDQGWDASSNP